MKKQILLALFIMQAGILLAQTSTKKYPDLDIPYKKYVLDNGLTLIVHEDHKAPIAAFNIWYHVGSKNEKTGKTGFAHLFEHLMFNGSEHYNKDYFSLMDQIGATDLNGTTNNDRTNYFENFPVPALEKVLWIESDRMGFMVGAIDSGKLSEQRGVVQNEKRQGENQPYAIAEDLTVKSMYPASHPYSWTVIGEMEDLDAASLDDVKEWFKTYYGPNNAVIVIAGDVNADETFEKVKKYFGDIPAGPPIAKHEKWIAKLEGEHRQTAQDRVPQARLQKTWNIPGWGTPEITYLNLLGDILTEGKSSRLYKKLVYDSQLTSNVNFFTDDKEIGGQFFLMADAKPGVSLDSINTIINQEMKKVLSQGVTQEELDRAKTRYFSSFIKGMERIGGFGGKSDILAQNETYGGSADYYKKIQQWVKNATIADLKKTANEWLTDGEYVLQILPYGDYKTAESTVKRTEQPPMNGLSLVTFPAVQQFALSNGLKVALVQRSAVPVVTMSLMFNAGYSADQFAKAGVASLAGRMLTEGTKTKNSLQISDQLADLGASMSSFSDIDNTYLRMNALKTNFDASLELYTDVLLNPSFPQSDFDRLKKEQLLRIKQEQARPVSMGLRILPQLLYGKGHAYSNPFTGSGTESSVSEITRNDMSQFHDTWFSPGNAMLFVVGDISQQDLKGKLERSLAGWKEHAVPSKNISEVQLAEKPSVYIIDKPGAGQSIIFAGVISPSAKDKDYESFQMMNRILGGEFTSRINMNLREDKHWSYGSYSFNLDAAGPSFFLGYAPVQTDKTKESVAELKKELSDFVDTRPATDLEFNKVQSNAVMQLPGIWETNSAVLGSLEDAMKYDRGINYLNNYPDMLRKLTLANIKESATRVIKPNNLTWVIVGDRSKIESGIKDLNLGAIKYIDTEGNEIK